MNILITGIHGFVGSNLVEYFKHEHTIYGLDIVAPEHYAITKTYNWEELKSLDFPKFDVIIHLAGKAHDTKNHSAAQLYFDINTGLTQRIFDFFLKSNAKQFIFFSSVKAAADIVLDGILTEEIIPTPVGPYGESKIRAEEYIQVNRPKDKQVDILRPCMIHGPGNKGNLNLLYNVVKKGIPWPLGEFENCRTFVSIDNLCHVVNDLVNKDIPSGVYHIADDEAMSTNDLISVICEAMGLKPRIWHLNRKMMEGCARLGTRLHLPLNEERLRKLTENYVVSNVKIKKALGIDKMPVTAREGMLKTIRSFEDNK